MKCILLPIHPEWCAKILNGDKSVEVRKGTTLLKVINNLIKKQGVAPCLIYCTSHRNYTKSLYEICQEDGGGYEVDKYRPSEPNFILNEKVFAIFEATAEAIESNQFSIRFTKTFNAFELEVRSCLTQTKIADYLVDNDGSPVLGTAIHIQNLQTFIKPIKLECYGVRKAPQSWCYVELADGYEASLK